MPDVSAADIAAYQRDGAVCLRGVIAAPWLELLRRGIERNLAEPGPYAKRYTPKGKPGFFFGDYCNWSRIGEYEEFLRRSPAASIAGALMGSRKVNLYHEHVLVKEPSTEERTPWHQDQPYYPIDGADVISLWIPLDPVPREVAIEFVAGSHGWGKWFQPKRFVDGAAHQAAEPGFEPVPDVEGDKGAYTILGWALEPGDLVAFSGLALHGAPGNSGTGRRRAFSARWTGDDAVFRPRPGFMSPPPPSVGGPEPGGSMDSAVFPVVWQA